MSEQGISSESGRAICRVFISYSHESIDHARRVLELAERLRDDGVDAQLDQYVAGTPSRGWPRWMLDELDSAQFILVVCTETYYQRFLGREEPEKGKGANWEGSLITLELYHARSDTSKFVPVLFERQDEPFIPAQLSGHTHYLLNSEENYAKLYAFLTGQAGVAPRKLGPLKTLAREPVEPLNFERLVEGPFAGEVDPPNVRQGTDSDALGYNQSASAGETQSLTIKDNRLRDPDAPILVLRNAGIATEGGDTFLDVRPPAIVNPALEYRATSSMQSPPNSANVPLRLSGKLVALSTWWWLGIGSVVALFVLKGIQGCLEDTVTSPLGFIVYAFTNRITNVSLWFVIFGFLSIWIIVGLLPDFAKAGLWTDGIHITLRWVAFAIALSVVEIGLYLSAVYRDGGTFFIQIPWGHDHTTYPGVHAVQVIEGLLNCILLSTMSLWVAIAHAAVSELHFYRSEGRAKLTVKLLTHVVWAALFPVLSFLGLSAAKITLDWHTGIANAAFAVATAILMWALFFWLMLRLVTDPYLRIEPTFTLPFFKVELRDKSP